MQSLLDHSVTYTLLKVTQSRLNLLKLSSPSPPLHGVTTMQSHLSTTHTVTLTLLKVTLGLFLQLLLDASPEFPFFSLRAFIIFPAVPAFLSQNCYIFLISPSTSSQFLPFGRSPQRMALNKALHLALYIALYMLLVFQMPWAASETSGEATREATSEAQAGSIIMLSGVIPVS